MGIGSRGTLATTLRRALASAAVFAQALLLLAPSGEAHEGFSGPAVIGAFSATQNAPALAPSHDLGHRHDTTTCPACIARSLHAQVAGATALPTHAVVERHSLQPSHAAAVSTGSLSAHRSRAPPTFS